MAVLVGRQSDVTGRALLVAALMLLAGCATGLRPPRVRFGVDLDGDATRS